MTTVEQAPALTKADAAELWGKLRNALAATQDAIAEIIRMKAWEPLGYDSFAAAWNAEMRAITLASELRPFVVYQLLDEGWSSMDVALQVKGVGPTQVENYDRQRKNGVPAGHAAHHVRAHYRSDRTPQGILRIPVGVDEMKRYKTIASERGLELERFLIETIREVFEKLEQA